MKTKFYILTFLAVIILGMVKGQTSVNQAFQNDRHFVLGYAHYSETERREFASVDDPTELKLRADDLMARAAQLQLVVNRRSGEERDRLIREIDGIVRKAEIYQLASAELAAYNTREEFNLSRANYKSILEAARMNQVITIKAAGIYAAAVKSYRMAIEMREEAYALPTVNATLGNLHNAEEKEMIALMKINEAIQVLREAPAPALVTR